MHGDNIEDSRLNFDINIYFVLLYAQKRARGVELIKRPIKG